MPYKNPINQQISFEWKDWKEFISQKFLACPTIRDWHAVIIEPEDSTISVANEVDQELRKIEIIRNTDAFSELKSIRPDGCSPSRVKELEFFHNFVLSNHKNFVSSNY